MDRKRLQIVITIWLYLLMTNIMNSVNLIVEDTPVKFKPGLIKDSILIHSGIFSPDMDEYYYTVSDKKFSWFNVMSIKKINQKWSEPSEAFFNTEYFEHGSSFSPDGLYIYFSSTRPAEVKGIADTWHIWRCRNINGQWSEPEFVNIPNMNKILVSHSSLTSDGTMYFHAGATDYSQLDIYFSNQKDGVFQTPVKLPEEINGGNIQVTPYISPDESFIIFFQPPNMLISYRDDKGSWSKAKPLNSKINRHNEGNPFLTPDKKYLYYAAGSDPDPKNRWDIYKVKVRWEIIDNPGSKD